jgi:hypothetical protein
MRPILLAALTAALALAVAAPASAAGTYHPCVPTSHAYPLYAKYTTCSTARAVARGYGTRYVTKYVLGYYCRVTGLDSASDPVVLCARGIHRVRWHGY